MRYFYSVFHVFTFLFFILHISNSAAAQEQISTQETVMYEPFSGNSFTNGWVSHKDGNLSWNVEQGVKSRDGNPGSAMRFSTSSAKVQNNLKVIAYTRELWLAPEHTHTFSFYHNNLSSGSATLDLVLNTNNQDKNGGKNVIKTLTLNNNNSEWTKHTVSFTVPTEGNYYIGFHITYTTGDLNIHIDDVTVTKPANATDASTTGSTYPVTLVSFNTQKKETNAVLSWKTAMEQNNKGFEVQASVDGLMYTAIGFVPAKSSNSSQGYSYTYTDIRHGKAGTVYYRLKQIDIDGQFEYFSSKAVNFGNASLTITASPNPFSSEVELNIGAATDEDLTIVLTDARGKEVFGRSISVSNGFNQERLQLPASLPSGLYLLSATWNNQSQTVKLVKR
ncbi:T9SS-dependent choice-of-anchor J family protein [Pontibacter sp. 13R65]|uniref:T9SS-dependent choice-of-anchor J family protein n=1 Tax=Pontibacter sp. 13R65 TaxID=3127458 RepID=UPI00301E2230